MKLEAPPGFEPGVEVLQSKQSPTLQPRISRNPQQIIKSYLASVGWNFVLLARHGDNLGDSLLTSQETSSPVSTGRKLNENEPANRYPTERESLCLVF